MGSHWKCKTQVIIHSFITLTSSVSTYVSESECAELLLEEETSLGVLALTLVSLFDLLLGGIALDLALSALEVDLGDRFIVFAVEKGSNVGLSNH